MDNKSIFGVFGWKNIRGNKTVSLAVMAFAAAAAMLLSLTAILAVNLAGAVDRLMEKAMTPHFMQMHSGAPRLDEVAAFAKAEKNVSDVQVLEFLNVDSSQIVLGENSLAGSVQDNGLCTQSPRFDFLLDLEDEPVRPSEGEVYVPVCYLRENGVKVGDQARICGRSFVVAGFVRDSQMNSSLASSKRFVVGEEDYRLLRPQGSIEYLLEFRLHDLSALGAFETAYTAAGLPANGPAVTWPLFRMINMVSDGMLVAVMMLIAVLVLLIALLCVRFTLLAKLEDDYREIGVMKGIGMRSRDIERMYLVLYAALAAAGSALGFSLSLVIQRPVQESIRLNWGGNGGAPATAVGGVSAVIVFALILLQVRKNLRRLRGISAVQAIRFGAEEASGRKAGGFLRPMTAEKYGIPINLFLGVQDVLIRKRLYAPMLAVVTAAAFILIVPQNLYHTISADGFVAYMGVGDCDLRLDIRQDGDSGEKAAAIVRYMENDGQIAECALFTTKILPVRRENGELENLKVELGNHAAFPVRYAEGRGPMSEDEIALSAINAEELESTVGEQIVLVTPEGERRLTVCGIYSDITNGGKTAKAIFDAGSAQTAWSVVCASLAGQVPIGEKAAEYSAGFPYAKVSGIGEYVEQTFGQTLQAVRTAAGLAVLTAAALTLLITALLMRLLAAKDRYSIAVLRAVGFTGRDIRHQYAWRAVFVLGIGIVLGTALAGTVGEKLAGVAVNLFGAESFRFVTDPVFTWILSPLILIFSGLLAAALGTFRAGRARIYESVNNQ